MRKVLFLLILGAAALFIYLAFVVEDPADHLLGRSGSGGGTVSRVVDSGKKIGRNTGEALENLKIGSDR